ncbi:hypothetical protein J7K93_06485 [bacterium]|nr:hypothetical protein [bacterium]
MMHKTVNKIEFSMLLCALFFSVKPLLAVEGIFIEGGLTHERTIVPGKTYNGKIVIRNEGDKAKGIRIYKTDYMFRADGANVYGEPGTMPRSCAEWITYSPTRLVVEAKSTSEVMYTITVPDADTLTGTYWSMFMIEPIPDNLLNPDISKEQIGVKVKWRYGVQIVLNAGTSGTKKLEFVGTKLLKEKDKKILQVDIENTGEFWLKPLVWVELYKNEGTLQGKYSSIVMRVFPGTSIRHKFDLTKVPGGTYKALIVADCGNDDLFGVNYTLKVGE